MSENKIGAKIVLDGEKEYREALKNINTDQKELRSEMKLNQAQFAENANSIEALTQKHEILTKQIESQKEKVEIYSQAVESSSQKQEEAKNRVEMLSEQYEKAQKELENMQKSSDTSNQALEEQQKIVSNLETDLTRATDAYNAAERSTSSWQTSLNNAQADLTTMDGNLQKTDQYLTEAKSSTDGCATSINEYGKEIQKASDDTLSFGDVLKANLASDLITAGLEKITELVQQAGKELLDAAVNATAYADNICTLSTETGIATDTLQELTYAEELMDTSLQTVTSSMAKNIKSMTSAREGSESYVEAYEKLGISIEDTNENFRDSETVFWECIDALHEINNVTERDSISMTLFGKKAQSLNSLIAIGSSGFQEFAQEAKDVGFVLDDDMLGTLNNTADSLERLGKRVDTEKNRIGVQLAPVIEDACDEIGDKVEELSDDVVDFAEDAIPKVIDTLEWIIDHGDSILAVITGIGAATVYHTTLAPAIVAINTAWKAYAASTQEASIGQWALNTAMNANPAGILVTAVVGLTTALGTYILVSDGATSETDKNIKKLQESKKELDENSAATEKNVSYIGQLKGEITELNKKEKLSNDEKSRMKIVVAELNNLMPDLSLSIDEVTGKVDENTKALDKNLEAALASYEAEANQEELTEIIQELSEAKKELSDITEKQTETETAYQDAMKATKEQYGENFELYGTAGVAELQMREQLNAQYEETNTLVNDLTNRYNELSGKMETATEETENLTDVTVDYKDRTYEIKGVTEEVAESIEGLQTAYQDAKTAAEDSISAQVGLFDELSIKPDLTTSQMSDNLSSQTQSFKQYTDDLNKAAELMNTSSDPNFKAVVDNLMTMGIDGAGYLHELVTSAETDTTSFNEVMKSFGEMEGAKDTLSETLADMQTGYSKSMDDMLGIQSERYDEQSINTEDYYYNMKNIVTKGNDEIVKDTSESLTDVNKSIVENTPVVAESITSMANTMIKSANSALGRLEGQTPAFRQIGKGMMEDLADGITKGSSAVTTALQKSITTAVDNMNIDGLVDKIDKRLGEAFSE